MPLRARGLADRPGEPYPAALRAKWTRRESNPHCRHARPASSRWTTGPESGDDGNRTQPVRVRGGLATLAHAPPFELRRPDLNRRGTAHETVLGPGSSPLRSQYSRQESNLRSPGCEPGAVASGPRECRVVPAGFEPATSTMSGWRALRTAPRDCQSGRQESNLPRTAYQTVASPPGPRPDPAPCTGLEPVSPVRQTGRHTRCVTGRSRVSGGSRTRLSTAAGWCLGCSATDTPSKDGRSRTLCVRVGA
jgi:hypothetical protein